MEIKDKFLNELIECIDDTEPNYILRNRVVSRQIRPLVNSYTKKIIGQVVELLKPHYDFKGLDEDDCALTVDEFKILFKQIKELEK